jgi:hypothetical protein
MGRVRVPSVHCMCLCVPRLLLPRGCSCSCVYVCVCVIYQKHARSMGDGVNRRIHVCVCVRVCVCAFTLSHTEVQRDIYFTYSRFIYNLLDMLRLRAHPTTRYTPLLEAHIRVPVQGTALGRSGKGAGGSNLGHNRSNPCTHTTNTGFCFYGLSFYRALPK